MFRYNPPNAVMVNALGSKRIGISVFSHGETWYLLNICTRPYLVSKRPSRGPEREVQRRTLGIRVEEEIDGPRQKGIKSPRLPMHMRGPSPNGRYVYGIIFFLFSSANLSGS